MSATKGVTARSAHPCESCSRRDVNGTCTQAIRPGHRYLQHTAFPGEEGFDTLERPFSVRECASCAIERDADAALMYGICGSYCHGMHPCVLPFERGAPGHDCVCSQCPAEAVTS